MVTCNGFGHLSIPQTLHLALPFLARTMALHLLEHVAVAGDIHGWASITGDFQNQSQWLWAPTIFPICLGVALDFRIRY